MIMAEGLMQAYHMSFTEAMALTVPQIVMLNHAAWYNQKRIEESVEKKYGKQGSSAPIEETTYNGKPIEEQDSAAWANYWNTWD